MSPRNTGFSSFIRGNKRVIESKSIYLVLYTGFFLSFFIVIKLYPFNVHEYRFVFSAHLSRRLE